MRYIIFLIIPLFFTGCNLNQNKIDSEKNENSNNYIIELINGEKLFVQLKYWGIGGKHEEITISEGPITIPNKESDYIFYTDVIYYELKSEKLLIYAPRSLSNVPEKLFNNIEVEFIDLKTSAEIEKYNRDYKKMKINRLDVFSKLILR